jgi:hypothetical protein
MSPLSRISKMLVSGWFCPIVTSVPTIMLCVPLIPPSTVKVPKEIGLKDLRSSRYAQLVPNRS